MNRPLPADDSYNVHQYRQLFLFHKLAVVHSILKDRSLPADEPYNIYKRRQLLLFLFFFNESEKRIT